MRLLSEFVDQIVVLHSYRYSPWALRAAFGGKHGEVVAQLIVLSGDRFGEEIEVYIANRQVVALIRRHLLGDFDGPMYGRVELGQYSAIYFRALDPIEESMYRAIVAVEPVTAT